MKKNVFVGVFSLCAAQAAFADAPAFDMEMDVVAAVLDDDGAANTSNALFDLMLGVEQEHLFDNGTALGFRLEGRVQADNESRPGYAGLFETVNLERDVVAAASPITGIATGSPAFDVGSRGGLELAYLYVDAPWGDVSLGRDVGAASILDARPPRLLNLVGSGSARLDPTGLAFARARNDATGPSTKITYLSPRWVGVRLGASFTPEVDPDSVDFDLDDLPDDVATADLENVAEFALSFRHRFAESGIRLRAGLTGTFAESSGARDVFSDYQAIGAGLELEKGDWQGGVRYLSSNNAVDSGEYEAIETSVLRTFGDWTLGAEYAHASDALLNLEGDSWTIGVMRALTDEVQLGVAYISDTLDPNRGAGRIGESKGLIFELTVRNK